MHWRPNNSRQPIIGGARRGEEGLCLLDTNLYALRTFCIFQRPILVKLSMAMATWANSINTPFHYCEQRLQQYGNLVALPVKFLLLAAVCYSIAWIFYTIFRNLKNPRAIRPRSPDPEKRTPGPSKFKAPGRTPGVWTPVDFKRPDPPPYPDWDVHTTKPLPYRPFKYGPYHITMGLRTMQWDDWIELDNHFPKFHADKLRRIEERGEKCSRTAPEGFDGACELLEEL